MKIYVASLCDYNAGVLHGKWIDVEDGSADRVHEEIQEMLAESPTAKQEGRDAEEFAIHDFEGFGDVRLSEYESIDRTCQIAEGVADHGVPFLAWVANLGNGEFDNSDFEDAYLGEWESLAGYVEDYWENCGGTPKAPEGQWWHPANYIDWDRMAHDLETSGDVWTMQSPEGSIWVFNH